MEDQRIVCADSIKRVGRNVYLDKNTKNCIKHMRQSIFPVGIPNVVEGTNTTEEQSMITEDIVRLLNTR